MIDFLNIVSEHLWYEAKRLFLPVQHWSLFLSCSSANLLAFRLSSLPIPQNKPRMIFYGQSKHRGIKLHSSGHLETPISPQMCLGQEAVPNLSGDAHLG